MIYNNVCTYWCEPSWGVGNGHLVHLLNIRRDCLTIDIHIEKCCITLSLVAYHYTHSWRMLSSPNLARWQVQDLGYSTFSGILPKESWCHLHLGTKDRCWRESKCISVFFFPLQVFLKLFLQWGWYGGAQYKYKLILRFWCKVCFWRCATNPNIGITSLKWTLLANDLTTGWHIYVFSIQSRDIETQMRFHTSNCLYATKQP